MSDCSKIAKLMVVDPQPGMTLTGRMPQAGATTMSANLSIRENVNSGLKIQVSNGLEGESFKRETVKSQGGFVEREDNIANFSGLGKRFGGVDITNHCPGFMVEILGQTTQSIQERSAAGDSNHAEAFAGLRVLRSLPINPNSTAVFCAAVHKSGVASATRAVWKSKLAN